MKDFSDHLRAWRDLRHLSQLALATEAGVSSRHISFLETRRARPSRRMILHLAETLDIPRQSRNEALVSAGFAPAYGARNLDTDESAQVNAAVAHMIDGHEPYPAIVLDRLWKLVGMNAPATRLFGQAGVEIGDSMVDLFLENPVIRASIENWAEVAYYASVRLRAESRHGGGIDALERGAAKLAADPEVKSYEPPPQLPQVVSTTCRLGEMRLSLFSTLTQFSSAENIALADLKIEMMFPADDASTALLRQLAQ